MKILVTGAKGFVGKSLVAELQNRGSYEIFEFDLDTDIILLDEYTRDCKFVFHLAGINRPKQVEEFMQGNCEFTNIVLNSLKKHQNKSPILITSSTQAILDNPYGKSKKAGEDALFEYSKETDTSTYVYRLPNIFGKGCRPNYNSAVATFCYNIANGYPIQINDPSVILNLVYIDDVVNSFLGVLSGDINAKNEFISVTPVHSIKLGEIAELLYSFKESRENKSIPNMSDPFTKKLYSTYLSYLPPEQFSYPLKMNIDERGSFTEFIKTPDRGQVSINISKPGITKGNHWHNTKCEKFLVVSGEGNISFRKVGSSDVISYDVSGDKLEVVDIPVGYTHNITNYGECDLVTIMWANEAFNKEQPDTYFMEV